MANILFSIGILKLEKCVASIFIVELPNPMYYLLDTFATFQTKTSEINLEINL